LGTAKAETISMKVAIVGKGGVGKTTLAAALARDWATQGRAVIAVDADPDGNLAAALGVPAGAVPQPIAAMRDLIMERTEANDQGAGLVFKLNPKVDDLPERFSCNAGGVRLLVLGTVELGGKGCMCPESAVLRTLMQHLFLRVSDEVIVDMEAGLEHLGRASARGVDAMIAVVEPGMRSVQTAQRVQRLAADIGIPRTLVVLNKISDPHDRVILEQALDGQKIVGELPYCPHLVRADLEGSPVDLREAAFAGAVRRLAGALESLMKEMQ
jgi:CO dehydrogenase maturation factor